MQCLLIPKTGRPEEAGNADAEMITTFLCYERLIWHCQWSYELYPFSLGGALL
jgi:hypothetical protein